MSHNLATLEGIVDPLLEEWSAAHQEADRRVEVLGEKINHQLAHYESILRRRRKNAIRRRKPK